MKAFLTGIVAAVGLAAAWILISFVLPIFGPMFIDRLLNRGGAASGFIGSDSILFAAFIGFVIGMAWGLRRFVITQ